MDEPSFALRAAATEAAARATKVEKLPVTGRDWRSGRHRLALVLIPDAGSLVAAEVRAASREPVGAGMGEMR